MPIGYLVTTGGVAAVAWSAVFRRRPRRSSPFRVSYAFGLWLNWPLVTFLVLASSTALAIDQSGVGSPGLRIGLGLAVAASAALVILRGRARSTGPVLEQALDDGLGADWRDGVDAALVARLRRRPSLARVLFAPISFRRRGVERIANIRYGPARMRNSLDLYRDRSGRSGRPTLIYLHARRGSKRLGARHLLYRLVARGWVCVSADYRASDPLVDVEQVIAWVREHAGEYGADPTSVFLAGSSLGGGLASRAALAATDASIAGLISLYGYYGQSLPDHSTTSAPPCFVAHGDQDTLVLVEHARGFVDHLRAASRGPVVYAELPGAQHGFDLFRSRRFDSVVDAIEVFTSRVRALRDCSNA
jgi:acetyl esterase/lipase